jgi:spore photoproduct lyase
MVPYPENRWLSEYKLLVDAVFSFFEPERITLGSLRGLQSTINVASDKSWTKYLSEPSKWGKRIPFSMRLHMFDQVIQYLEKEYSYQNVALCKEPRLMWEKLGMDWKKCGCNCVW